ncbi:hypothetical protein HDU77_003695 [Chytriomyces hyalinus]|nr:hypothetical protein HDU77_003695 [Chytriomyces hyalinus]
MISGLTNPTDTITLLVVFPTYLVGLLLNGGLVAVILSNRRALLVNRIDWIVATISSMCMCLSAFFSVRFVIAIATDVLLVSDTFQRVCAAATTLSVAFMFAGAIALAMERYFTLSDVTERDSFKYYVYLAIYQLYTISVVCWAFATSPSSNLQSPDFPLQRTMWLFVCVSSMTFGLALIVWLYVSTYYRLKRMLQVSLCNHTVDGVRLSLQRNVFRNSVILSMATVVCYAPNCIFLGVSGAVNMSPTLFAYLNCITYAMFASDVVISPVLVYMFFPNLQAAVRRSLQTQK